MPGKKSLIDAKGEVRELTVADLSALRPPRKALPRSLRRKVGIRGPQKAPTKERITIRLSRSVVERFRARARDRRGLADACGCGAAELVKEAQAGGLNDVARIARECHPGSSGREDLTPRWRPVPTDRGENCSSRGDLALAGVSALCID